MTAEFLITSFFVVLAPGTGVLYTLAHGLSRGASASVVAAFGCTLGILPHIAAAVFGLAALLHTSTVAFQVVKILGVAYLLYMAWGVLREKGALSVDQKVERRSNVAVAVKGFLINILNPKLSMFFLAFLPQFVSPHAEAVTMKMLGLGGIFMVMTFVVFVLYGLFAAAVRDRIISRPRVMTWFRRGFACTFVGLGAKLAMTER